MKPSKPLTDKQAKEIVLEDLLWQLLRTRGLYAILHAFQLVCSAASINRDPHGREGTATPFGMPSPFGTEQGYFFAAWFGFRAMRAGLESQWGGIAPFLADADHERFMEAVRRREEEDRIEAEKRREGNGFPRATED